jgi:integrase
LWTIGRVLVTDRLLDAIEVAERLQLTGYSRKAIQRAGITKPFRPWHGLRHTALTETAAAGVPAMFVQAKAGHAQGSTTERYLHAAKTNYPDMAGLAEARMFTAEEVA